MGSRGARDISNLINNSTKVVQDGAQGLGRQAGRTFTDLGRGTSDVLSNPTEKIGNTLGSVGRLGMSPGDFNRSDIVKGTVLAGMALGGGLAASGAGSGGAAAGSGGAATPAATTGINPAAVAGANAAMQAKPQQPPPNQTQQVQNRPVKPASSDKLSDNSELSEKKKKSFLGDMSKEERAQFGMAIGDVIRQAYGAPTIGGASDGLSKLGSAIGRKIKERRKDGIKDSMTPEDSEE